MAWTTPKTDWFGGIDSVTGLYEGDRFNATDYNRIKNNLVFLKDLANTMYDEFEIVTPSADKVAGDYFYADEINILEDNLETINENSINRSYGEKPVYNANGHTFDFVELNRLESAILDLYDRLCNQSEGRRNFTWNFGMKGGLF